MSVVIEAALAQAKLRFDTLLEESETMHRKLVGLRRELVELEQVVERSRRPGLRASAQPAPDLDSLLARLDEEIAGCERARRAKLQRVEMAQRSVLLSERELEDLGDERELALNIWAAGAQLREARDIERVRATVLEIVTNLIGCEEVGLFERRPGPSASFLLTRACGLAPERRDELVPGQGWIGRRIAEGTTFTSTGAALDTEGEDPAADGLSALVPLWVGKAAGEPEACAVLLLFGLPPDKSGFGFVDLGLLELIRDYAGRILLSARRRRTRHRHAPLNARL